MAQDDVVVISSSDDSDGETYVDRRSILEPVVRRVVDALGGYEAGKYRLGDEVNRCLQDLKKLWRKDDTDDERTVARIFWETRVLPNDLVPILLATAGEGVVEDKRAISCADLMAAMTWPIDMAEELKELDEELDKGTDYTQLLLSHLNYKAALLRPGVMQALFGIVLPPLSKHLKERSTRDRQIVNVVLHLVRNLAFIQDLPPNMHLSSDQAEYSSLHTKLVNTLSDTRMLELLLTISTNSSNDPWFNSWNTLVLEILYLLFRGVKPSSLAGEQAKESSNNLHRLLAKEESLRRNFTLTAPSRHSRFGTTITISLNPNKTRQNNKKNQQEPGSELAIPSQSLIFYRQRALDREAGSIIDLAKRQKPKKANKVDELAREDNLSLEARGVLQNLATEFVQSCFNPFLAGLLKDIKSERPKVTEKDHIRLLYVTKWFLEFFLCARSKNTSQDGQSKWSFEVIAEVMERGWIIWVLKRMREAVEEKPKLWTEVQAGIECLTQLLLLIDTMSSVRMADLALNEAADLLQEQLVYNGEVLDIALESLRSYKEGIQSLTFLDSAIHLSYSLLRMLERWGKTRDEEMYVRKRTKRRKKAGRHEDDAPHEEEEEASESEHVTQEAMFNFEAFEMKFAHPEITHTLLTYLARYKDFTSDENMKRVVSLMHRQAVKAKAEGLFFKVSTLELFKTVLAEQKSFPREQPYKDLVNLINFILRKFFKSLAEDRFLAVETFFPKNRGQWKHFSSREPEEMAKKKDQSASIKDIQVKKGYAWSDQLGIVIALLAKNGKKALVEWTRDILMFIIEKRQAIIDETDGKCMVDTVEEHENSKLAIPSSEALAKIVDYPIPCINNEQAEGTRDPEARLLLRLAKFQSRNEDDDQPDWYVPAGITPSVLRRVLTVLEQFLETPYDLQGKDVSELLSKRQRRRHHSADSDNEDKPKKKREKKEKEDKQYKSATFIEDSDAEYGDIDAFLEKEKVLRERMSRAAVASGKIATMKATGTKKRRRRGEKVIGKKRKGNDESVLAESASDVNPSEESDSGGPNPRPTLDRDPAFKRMRPRPRQIVEFRPSKSSPVSEREASNSTSDEDSGAPEHDRVSPDGKTGEIGGGLPSRKIKPLRRKMQLVISDDES